jgi:uncharacterized protein (TIGR03435 family)
MSVAAASVAIFHAALPLFAQPAPPAPVFEVASVKPSKPDARGSSFNFTPGGGLTVQNGTLKGVIEAAYDVRDFQILGGPGWVASDRYDIFAKSLSGDPPPQPANRQEDLRKTRQRLQALLAERFQLKVHRETKELPVFALVVGKNGSKLTESAEAPANSGAGIRSGCGQMTGTRTPMSILAVVLSRQLSRPVLERTGLSGKYDFQLGWTPDEGPCPAPPDGATPAAADSSPELPSLLGALQEQLGLKLEPTKGPVEIIVIDHAEKAAEN